MNKPMVAKADPGLEVPESMVYFVMMTMFIDVIAACISTPVMPYYAQEFGVPTAWIGYIYACWSVTSAVFAPCLSSMSDKWGRKYVLVCCLVGAGIANVIQGLALYFGKYGFAIFLLGRAFSGCWASVGATCNVYISDVAPSEALRSKYLGQLSMVPLVAIMTGPGLGGGLASAFGNNFPVLVDGILTLFSACVVQVYLVETPAFLRSKLEGDVEKGKDKEQSSSSREDGSKLPRAVYVVGLAAFLAAIASQANLSMLSLFYQQVYDFSTLYVGFLFMGNAVVMLLSNMVIVSQLKKCVGSIPISFVGSLVGGCCNIALGLSSLVGNLNLSLVCQYIGGIGGALTMSQSGTIFASFTNVGNRGKVFGLMQTFQNFGKIIGPIIGTNIAVTGLPGIDGFMGLPFCLSGGLTMISACVMLSSLRFVPQDKTSHSKGLQRRATTFGDAWEDELGSEEDVKALGKFMSQLLTDRHYKWVTRRAEIEKLLDDLLPELETEDRLTYEESFKATAAIRMQTATVANIG